MKRRSKTDSSTIPLTERNRNLLAIARPLKVLILIKVLTEFIIVSLSCSLSLIINADIQFVKDQVSETYSRSVFGFLDLTGNMGGVFGILQTAGSFIVSIFAGKIFLYSMLSRLYQVDNCLIEESDHDEKEKSNQDKTIKVMPLQSYQADNKYHVSTQNRFGQ
jgi:hypothetical protein